MYVNVKKKTLLIWGIASAVVILGLSLGLIFADRAHAKAESRYQSEMSGVWRQSVADLSESLAALDLKLQKGLYASSDYQTVAWAAQVFAEAGQAHTALEELPIYELQLTSTETFLNQAGEYTLYTARKILRGEELSDTEKNTLKQLSARAQELSGEVALMALRVNGEHPDYDALSAWFAPSGEGKEKTDLERLEDIFSGDEALIYDGTYSAWRAGRTAKMLENETVLPGVELRKAAAAYLGCTPDVLIDGDESRAPIPELEYKNGDDSVFVTQKGGRLASLSRLRDVGERTITAPRALELGTNALRSFGYPGMEPVRWSISGNVLTAVYALRQDGVLYYADQITLSVALDNGDVTGLDASEYLLSHTETRTVPQRISEEEARAVLRTELTVNETDFVCIPGGDGTEKYCYQFTVRDDTETDVMIFVNAVTGVEEDIMILLQSEELRRTI